MFSLINLIPECKIVATRAGAISVITYSFIERGGQLTISSIINHRTVSTFIHLLPIPPVPTPPPLPVKCCDRLTQHLKDQTWIVTEEMDKGYFKVCMINGMAICSISHCPFCGEEIKFAAPEDFEG